MSWIVMVGRLADLYVRHVGIVNERTHERKPLISLFLSCVARHVGYVGGVMNTEQQNIAIAESLGAKWQDIPPSQFYIDCDRVELWPKRLLSFVFYDTERPQCAPLPFPDPDGNASVIPDYTGDLNAIHEAENALDVDVMSTESPGFTYHWHLCEAVPRDRQPFRATAAQRSEAYLRTIGKWVDSND